jgi:hypothetical protein
MKTRRWRRTIIREVSETLQLSDTCGATVKWCSECQQSVPMLPLREAAAVVGQKQNTLYRWVTDGHLHSTQLTKTGPSICLVSLVQLNRKRDKP